MLGFLLHDAAGNTVQAIEITDASMLPAAPAGLMWLSCPTPASRYEVKKIGRVYSAIDFQQPPSIELVLCRARKLMDIKEAHARAVNSGIETEFGRVQSDAASQQNIQSILLQALIAEKLNLPFSTSFTMEDNTEVILDAQKLFRMYMQIRNYASKCRVQSDLLRAELAKVIRVEQLDLLYATTGWPDNTPVNKKV